jgi:hypothetical protein
MSHPLEAFSSSLDLDASKVINSPSLIFLCGGPIPAKAGADPSLRALFYQRLKDNHPDLFKKVLLAEEANKWSKTAKHYDNLFVLENDLAFLSAVILLFVESAGSFAELGTFCQAPALRKKLVAILEHTYYHQAEPSFIRDGPVAFLEQEDDKSVLVHHWLGADTGAEKRPLDLDKAQDTVGRLIEWLSSREKSHTKEARFRKNNRGHRLLLIADLINLGSVVQRREIISSLGSLGVNLEGTRLDRYLFLLEKLNLVRKTKEGHRTYYLAGAENVGYVAYTYKSEGKAWDRLRVQLDLRDELWTRSFERRPVFEQYL